jgi:hypothetical protein
MLISDLKKLFRKTYQKKIILKNCFLKKNLPKSLEKMFFGVKLFLVLFLNNFSRAEIGMKFWTLDARIDLFQTIFFALRRDLLLFFYTKIRNPHYKG